jgi:hypothetical protein
VNPNLVWTLVVVIAVGAAGLACFLFLQPRVPAPLQLAGRRRRHGFRRRFGAEFQRTVQAAVSERRADRMFAARTNRSERFQLRRLSETDSARFVEAWRQLQTRFVVAPHAAVGETDRFAAEVLAARGCPLGEFNQRAVAISVDHPRVVVTYRAAHAIATRHSHDEATQEDLRQALVHFRALFEDLLDLGECHARQGRRDDLELVGGGR